MFLTCHEKVLRFVAKALAGAFHLISAHFVGEVSLGVGNYLSICSCRIGEVSLAVGKLSVDFLMVLSLDLLVSQMQLRKFLLLLGSYLSICSWWIILACEVIPRARGV